MNTKTVFVVYRTTIVDKEVIEEDVIDFSYEREIADKIKEIEEAKGYSCKVEKELAVTDGNSEMFIIKHNKTLDASKAKEFKDFKDHVIQGLSGFDKRVLLNSGALKI